MPNGEQELVENLTREAEEGKSVSDILNQIPFQERLEIAKQMDALNEQHRQADSSLPDLVLTTENDSGGNEHLTDIKSKKSSDWTGTDIYDLPKTAQWQGLDLIVNTQMERDSADSKHLRKPVENKSFYTGTGERK